jgi:arsenate reductase (glutaredoxin)
MSNLQVYHYSKCGTCRKAIKWLQAKGHELELHDLFEQAPSVGTIRDWVERSGLESKKFFNVSGEVYKALNLKDKLPQMSENDKIELLASNGRLIKRPVITDGSRVTVGFKETELEQVWGE